MCNIIHLFLLLLLDSHMWRCGWGCEWKLHPPHDRQQQKDSALDSHNSPWKTVLWDFYVLFSSIWWCYRATRTSHARLSIFRVIDDFDYNFTYLHTYGWSSRGDGAEKVDDFMREKKWTLNTKTVRRKEKTCSHLYPPFQRRRRRIAIYWKDSNIFSV